MNSNNTHSINVAIIGGGAAGFFSAICVKTNYPDAEVTIFEKTRKILSKVRISGGGRCNVTNGSTSIKILASSYPRGGKLMKKLLHDFSTVNIMDWFESRGVSLKVEKDNRVFPVSNSSQTIIDCLTDQIKRLNIGLVTKANVKSISQRGSQLLLSIDNRQKIFDKIIIATGGCPNLNGFEWLSDLDHKIENPTPSLFTFNMPNEKIRKLMGVVADDTSVSIQGLKIKSEGPLLITHWGMSGPAILKLSAYGARILNELDYKFNVSVNWINIQNTEEVLVQLKKIASSNPKKYLSNVRPFNLPDRLWVYILDNSRLPSDKQWQDLGKKGFNKLISVLTNDIYSVSGKTTFKEEFVTCGGVSLESINHKTLESLVCPNLYFAGEVLDIDGVTGGFNFQAAWTTAFVAGELR